MKLQQSSEKMTRRVGATNTFALALVAALAVGLGVTGTLLWTQNRASAPISAGTAPVAPISPSAPAVAAAPSIAGMTPPQAALTMGNYHYDQQRWTQAMESYRAAIAGGFDNPNVRTDLGNALRFAGQPQKALEQYLIAQKQDPNHEQSLFNQGGLWAFTLKNKPKAVAAWRAYVKRFPQGQSAAQAQQFIIDNQ